MDAEGRKLSKSRGNYIALDKLINQHGADILRLWVASTDYRHEVAISDEIIKRNADAYRRIRNTARFLLANLFDFVPSEHAVKAMELVELDRFIIKRCQQLQQEIIAAYQSYHFHVIYQKIHNFCAVDLGSFYLDVIKDRQYTTAKNSVARRSCQTAMYHIVHALTRWLAPILSFTADEIWQFIPGSRSESVFLERWYEQWPAIQHVDMAFWQKMQIVRDEVNKALESKRKEGVIGSALAAEVTVYAGEQLFPLLSKLGDELRFVFITSSAIVKPMSQCKLPSPSEQTSENNSASLAPLPPCGHPLPVSGARGKMKEALLEGQVLRNKELDLAIAVNASGYEKCARCWHRREEVGSDPKQPDLCQRCIGNIRWSG